MARASGSCASRAVTANSMAVESMRGCAARVEGGRASGRAGRRSGRRLARSGRRRLGGGRRRPRSCARLFRRARLLRGDRAGGVPRRRDHRRRHRQREWDAAARASGAAAARDREHGEPWVERTTTNGRIPQEGSRERRTQDRPGPGRASSVRKPVATVKTTPAAEMQSRARPQVRTRRLAPPLVQRGCSASHGRRSILTPARAVTNTRRTAASKGRVTAARTSPAPG